MSYKCNYFFLLEKCCCCISLKKGIIALGLSLIGTHSLYLIGQMALTFQMANATTGHWADVMDAFADHMTRLIVLVGYHTVAVCMAIVHVSGAIQNNCTLLKISLWWNCFNCCFVLIASILEHDVKMAFIIIILVYYTILNYSFLHQVTYELNSYLADDNEWSYEMHPFYN